MELHSGRLTSLLLLLGAFCLCIMCVRVLADAMVPQTCTTQTSQPCQALIGYVPSSNYNLLEIASLFSLNYTSLLGPNDIDPSLQNLSRLVLPATQPAFIPQTCGCVNGHRAVTSANYTVIAGNTLSLISDTIYSGLLTYQEIANANSVSNPDLIEPGQVFSIPIPCACFNQSNSSQPSIALSYQIQKGDSLEGIADAHNTSVPVLKALNSLTSLNITASSVLFVPLSVCKANFSSGALDSNLTVVEGKYELTANGCVKCSCTNGTLHCVEAPASLGSTCANLTCPSSNLELGSSTASQGNGECTVRSCVYRGYTAQSGITATLETEQDTTCPVALPPETYYKPPSDLVASPLPTVPSITASSSPPTTPAAATPPSSPTSTNPSSAVSLLAEIGSSSWWWPLLLAGLLL